MMRARLLLVLIGGLICGPLAMPGLLQAQSPSHGSPRVLLVNQRSAAYPIPSERRGYQIEMLVRHFTQQVEHVDARQYQAGDLSRFDQVIVLVNDAVTALPASLLADVSRLERPVMWLGYGLHQLPIGMLTNLGVLTLPDSDIRIREVEYRGERFPSEADEFSVVQVDESRARVLAWYGVVDRGVPGRLPYLARAGDFWYVNGFPSLDSDYPDPKNDAPTLVFADILHDFFGTDAVPFHRAIVRLEDVSVHVAPDRLVEVADFLSSQRVPFALGLIPAQRLQDGTVVALQDRPEFVQALRYAQDRGATFVLHGYHHTFGSGEDFEFWDDERNAPLPNETWDLYATKVEDGIKILRDLGLEPRMWETPHYAASPLAYRVFGRYFSHAIENREPASWLPYPSGPDRYGQMLIPENIGYINADEGWTVEAQLKRARLLRIVRDSWAVGFYHPAGAPLADLQTLVRSLREAGYTFADLRAVPTEVRSSYRPSPRVRLGTWLAVDARLGLKQIDRWLEQHIDWWSGARRIPWPSLVLLSTATVFLARLRLQWQPLPAHVKSRLEAPADGRASGRMLGLVAGPVLLALLLATTAWATNAEPLRRLSRSIRSVSLLVPTGASPIPLGPSDGWEVSIYFTAVESYYSGPPQDVIGCLRLECVNGSDPLGTYPSDFVQAVRDEGTGRIVRGPNAGRYLNWSIDSGYWLDTSPRDARGLELEAYVSAAADPSIPYDSVIRLMACGADISTSEPIAPGVCSKLSDRPWIVRDRFTVGGVGKHIDLYLGEQDRSEFLTRNPLAIHARGATVSLGPPQ